MVAIGGGGAAQPERAGGSVLQRWGLVALFGGLYISSSAGLISFNKYLIHEDRFPFAAILCMCHMAFSTVYAGLMRVCCPSWFPSLTDPEKKVPLTWSLLLGKMAPISVMFALQLILSNTAYLYSSVAFLQMMKEANIVLVYFFSLLAALEAWKWRSFNILIFITFATCLTIHGEMRFSFLGFCLQATSQLTECTKIVLQAVVLCGATKLDPMSYVLVIAPMCVCVLLATSGILTYVVPDHGLVAALPRFLPWLPYLALNSTLAFSMNIIMAFYIKYTDGVAFILAGVTKDIFIVSVGSAIFGEHISALQAFAFCLQIYGIFMWSLCKTFPSNFEHGFVQGVGITFGLYKLPDKKLVGNYGSVA